MADRADITPELIRQLFEFKDGRYYWLAKDRSEFGSKSAYYAWNTRFAGKEAMVTNGANGYLQVRIKRITFPAHRVIWAFHYGEWPADFIDHIDGNRKNNALENLRVVDRLTNCRNQRKHSRNASGVCGVNWHKCAGQWRAFIGVGGKSIHLGEYDHIDEAIAARKAAEIVLGFHPNHGGAAA